METDEFGGVALDQSTARDEFGGIPLDASKPDEFGGVPLDSIRDPRKAGMQSEMDRLQAQGEAGFMTGFGTELKENVGEFGRGAVQFIPATLKALGRTADWLNRNVVDLGGGRSSEDMALTRLGKAGEQLVDETLPQAVNPEDLSGQFSRGLGQVAGALATGGGARLAGAGSRAAARLATLQMAGAEFDDAYERSRARGDDPDTAFAKSLGYATVASLIENKLGAGRLMRNLFPDAAQAASKLTALGVSKEIGKNILANYGEEFSQRAAQNLIVAPEEGVLTGAHDEGVVGGLVGGLAGMPGALTGGVRRRLNTGLTGQPYRGPVPPTIDPTINSVTIDSSLIDAVSPDSENGVSSETRRPIITPYTGPTVSSPGNPIITPPPQSPAQESTPKNPAIIKRMALVGKKILLARGVDEATATEFAKRFAENTTQIDHTGEAFRSELNDAFDSAGLLDAGSNRYSNEKSLREAAEANGFTEEQIQATLAKREARAKEIEQHNKSVLEGKPAETTQPAATPAPESKPAAPAITFSPDTGLVADPTERAIYQAELDAELGQNDESPIGVSEPDVQSSTPVERQDKAGGAGASLASESKPKGGENTNEEKWQRQEWLLKSSINPSPVVTPTPAAVNVSPELMTPEQWVAAGNKKGTQWPSIHAAIKDGKPINAALHDEVVSGRPKNYVQDGDVLRPIDLARDIPLLSLKELTLKADEMNDKHRPALAPIRSHVGPLFDPKGETLEDGFKNPEKREAIRKATESQRELLRKKYGDTITVYRAQDEFPKMSAARSIFSWTLDEDVAKQHGKGRGRKIISKTVPVDAVLYFGNPAESEILLNNLQLRQLEGKPVPKKLAESYGLVVNQSPVESGIAPSTTGTPSPSATQSGADTVVSSKATANLSTASEPVNPASSGGMEAPSATPTPPTVERPSATLRVSRAEATPSTQAGAPSIDQEFVDMVDTAGEKTTLSNEKKQAGRGVKGSIPALSLYSPDDVAAGLTPDLFSEQANNRGESQKVAIVQDKDGSIHLALATENQNGRRLQMGKNRKTELVKLIDLPEGSKVIGAVKLTKPVKSFHRVLTADQWAKTQEEIEARIRSAKDYTKEIETQSAGFVEAGDGESKAEPSYDPNTQRGTEEIAGTWAELLDSMAAAEKKTGKKPKLDDFREAILDAEVTDQVALFEALLSGARKTNPKLFALLESKVDSLSPDMMADAGAAFLKNIYDHTAKSKTGSSQSIAAAFDLAAKEGATGQLGADSVAKLLPEAGDATAGEQPAFSTRTVEGGKGLTTGQVLRALMREKEVVPVQVVTEAEAIDLIGPSAKGKDGFYWGGRIWLVADNLADVETVKKVWREEQAHATMRTDAGKAALDQLRSSAELNLTEAEAEELRWSGFSKEERARGTRYRDEQRANGRGYQESDLLEEFIAKSVRENSPWWKKAIEWLRVNLFSKIGLANLSNAEIARAFLRTIGKPEVAPVTPSVEQPAFSSVNPADDEMTTSNVMGLEEEFERRKLTPEDTAAGERDAERLFDDAGIPVTRLRNNLLVPTDRTPNQNEAGQRLLSVLRRELDPIVMHRLAAPDAPPNDRRANFINSVREFARLQLDEAMGGRPTVFSKPILDELLGLSQQEASEAGKKLFLFKEANINEIDRIATAPRVLLRQVWSDGLFGGDGNGTGSGNGLGDMVRTTLQTIQLYFQNFFTAAQVRSILNQHPDAKAFLENLMGESTTSIKPKVDELIATVFATPFYREHELSERLRDLLVKQLRVEPAKANEAKRIFEQVFARSIKQARKDALDKAWGKLSPPQREAKTRRGKKLWQHIVDFVNSGGLEHGVNAEGGLNEYAVMKKLAAESGTYRVPTEKELDELKAMSERVQRLLDLSPRQLAEAGNDPARLDKARREREAATMDERKELQRRMMALWQSWSRPLSWKHWFAGKDIARNNAQAIDEMVAGNVLARLTFATKQAIDIATTNALYTPGRALAHAWQRYQDDIDNGAPPDRTRLFREMGDAVLEAYRVRNQAIKGRLRAVQQGLRGRGLPQNVEGIMSGMMVFDRMSLKIEELGKKQDLASQIKRFGMILAAFQQAGYRFSAALDVMQGMPAELQEMRHQAETELRKQGQPKEVARRMADDIVGDMKAEYAGALSEARTTLEESGIRPTEGELSQAAWNILKARIYGRMKAAEMQADDFEARNQVLRQQIGWNLPQTGGLGGWMAKNIKGIKRVFNDAGIPTFGIAAFGNSIGNQVNRMLTWTGLGMFPTLFNGDPFYASEIDRRQRFVEAATGAPLTALALLLAATGTVIVRLAWPEDKKEREEWERTGKRPGQLAIPDSDGNEIRLSLTTGPFSYLRPALAAGGAYRGLVEKKAKEQEKLNAEAAAKGIAPGKADPIGITDILAATAQTASAAILGGRTTTGIRGAFADYGKMDLTRSGAQIVSSVIPLMPAYQEMTRLAGVTLDPKRASFFDLVVPMSSSGAQRVNMLGDPVGTPSALERVFGMMTGGAGIGLNADIKASGTAYANLFASDYRPPAVTPGKAFNFNGVWRPMTPTEFDQYVVARGQAFKAELSALGPLDNATPEEAKNAVGSAFRRADQTALQSLGVQPPSRGAAASATGGQSVRTSGASGVSTGRRPVAIGGLPATRRASAPTISAGLGGMGFRKSLGGGLPRLSGGGSPSAGLRSRLAGLRGARLPRLAKVAAVRPVRPVSKLAGRVSLARKRTGLLSSKLRRPGSRLARLA